MFNFDDCEIKNINYTVELLNGFLLRFSELEERVSVLEEMLNIEKVKGTSLENQFIQNEGVHHDT